MKRWILLLAVSLMMTASHPAGAMGSVDAETFLKAVKFEKVAYVFVLRPGASPESPTLLMGGAPAGGGPAVPITEAHKVTVGKGALTVDRTEPAQKMVVGYDKIVLMKLSRDSLYIYTE